MENGKTKKVKTSKLAVYTQSKPKTSVDSHDCVVRPTSAVSTMSKRPNGPVEKKSVMTDETGRALFEAVPFSNYLISVVESKSYMGNAKMLDLIRERTIQPVFNVFIELKPQQASFVEVTLLNDEGAKLPAAATALLLSPSEAIEADSTFSLMLQGTCMTFCRTSKAHTKANYFPVITSSSPR